MRFGTSSLFLSLIPRVSLSRQKLSTVCSRSSPDQRGKETRSLQQKIVPHLLLQELSTPETWMRKMAKRY